jgi:predicted O-methyltransferase YrrM
MKPREDTVGAWHATQVFLRYLVTAPSQPARARSFFGALARYASYYGSEPRHLPGRSLHQVLPGIDDGTVCLRHTVEAKALPFGEAFVLAALTDHLKPRRVFEIGTFTGGATRIMAEHGRDDAALFTLDLPPDDKDLELAGLAYDPPEGNSARIGERFKNTPVEPRITQLFGDSAGFDFSPYAGSIDLVFVDGSHSYAYVKADSENALRMLSPRGTIVWDDCSYVYPGLVRALDELGRRMSIYRIASTRFAIYHRPGAA